MTAPDHAAALALLEKITGDHDAEAFNNRQRAIAALPELAALYRAGVELETARLSRALVDTDEKEERFYLALIAFDAALAAVADKLNGEGK